MDHHPELTQVQIAERVSALCAGKCGACHQNGAQPRLTGAPMRCTTCGRTEAQITATHGVCLLPVGELREIQALRRSWIAKKNPTHPST